MKHGIYFASLLTVDGTSADDVAFDAPSGESILVKHWQPSGWLKKKTFFILYIFEEYRPESDRTLPALA